MISILVPSRKRPNTLLRMYASAMETADRPEEVEVVARIDDDDHTYSGISAPRMTILVGPREGLASAWNECADKAKGELMGLVGDDIIFRTKGWDTIVKQKFEEFEDKILYVFGDDLGNGGRQAGTHGFIHRNWVDTVGYFVPPYFAASQVDHWLNEVARKLGRLRYGDIIMEHVHWAFGKADKDQVYEEGSQRAIQADKEWHLRQGELDEDVAKLREFIDAY